MTDTPSDADLETFQALANRFMELANSALTEWEPQTVSAAFLYGCARYNSFVLQTQDHQPGEIDAEPLAYFRQCYIDEVQGHMAETLMSGAHSNVERRDFTLQDLIEVDGWPAEDRQGFFDMADAFIAVANDAKAGARITRISAAFMHACARFNVYVMQIGGLAPGIVDAERVETYADAYAGLLRMHMKDHLIPPGT